MFQTEITGPVVPVDDDRDFNDCDPVPIGGTRSPIPRKPPAAHQIVSREMASRQPTAAASPMALPPGKRPPPKFSTVINEYMGGCLEEHCKIGKKSVKTKEEKEESSVFLPTLRTRRVYINSSRTPFLFFSTPKFAPCYLFPSSLDQPTGRVKKKKPPFPH